VTEMELLNVVPKSGKSC